ncbi:MAG: hypothetical protein ACYCW6_06760 [Candidatus Xenobia bacterium]
MNTRPDLSPTVRRSFALPRQLLEEAMHAAPAELHDNLNRLVRLALEEFVAHRREEAFARQMAEMARDPQIQTEISSAHHEFRNTELDGL